MIATTTQTSAAPSTSAAPARASHAPATQEAAPGIESEGFGLPSEADIASALDLPPEGQTTESADATAIADPATDDATAETLPEGEAAAEAEGDVPAADDAGQPAEDAATPGEAASDAGAETDKTEPKVPEGVQTRINELTAARRSAEERVAALTEQLASYQARDAGRFEPDVLETIDDPATLDRQKTQWSQLHRWAAQNLTAPEAKLGEKVYSTEEVGAIFAQTSQLLTEAAPKRAAYLAERAHFDHATAQIYPWAADTKSGDGATLHRALTTIPELRRLPNGRLIAADSLVGLKLRDAGIKIDDALIKRLKEEQARTAKTTTSPAARAATSAPVAPVRRLPPSAPARPGTVPSRAPAAVIARKRADERMARENGSMPSVADAILAGM